MTPTTGGPGLDLEIDERVMGFRSEMGDEPPGRYPVSGVWPQGHDRRDNCPAYSTEIGPAFEVVEAMRARQADGPMDVLIGHDHTVGKWRAEFLAPADVDRSVWADTLPLAICLAALVALEHHSPEKAAVPSLHRETSIHG